MHAHLKSHTQFPYNFLAGLSHHKRRTSIFLGFSVFHNHGPGLWQAVFPLTLYSHLLRGSSTRLYLYAHPSHPGYPSQLHTHDRYSGVHTPLLQLWPCQEGARLSTSGVRQRRCTENVGQLQASTQEPRINNCVCKVFVISGDLKSRI